MIRTIIFDGGVLHKTPNRQLISRGKLLNDENPSECDDRKTSLHESATGEGYLGAISEQEMWRQMAEASGISNQGYSIASGGKMNSKAASTTSV